MKDCEDLLAKADFQFPSPFPDIPKRSKFKSAMSSKLKRKKRNTVGSEDSSSEEDDFHDQLRDQLHDKLHGQLDQSRLHDQLQGERARGGITDRTRPHPCCMPSCDSVSQMYSKKCSSSTCICLQGIWLLLVPVNLPPKYSVQPWVAKEQTAIDRWCHFSVHKCGRKRLFSLTGKKRERG